jgi:alanine dehydrogenase
VHAATTSDPELAMGMNTFDGAVTNAAVADALGQERARFPDL